MTDSKHRFTNVHDFRTGNRFTSVARLVFVSTDSEPTEHEVGRFIQRTDGDGSEWSEFVPARDVDDVGREPLESVHARMFGGERPLLTPWLDEVQDLDALDFAVAFPEDAFDDT